ncbi:DUF742 domain-containing protein [Pseudosporangium ferrugineum]|uniref:Uncharacterized protein DUF742 n=1 Tax=Pseudosporangium ferrugineum TaxID=439699 RepID=A0A2T0RHV9_9ACTN|nr:DUF742 domain-containing protein [Pseudosporangium ferrugineum]PRY20806.1 uncharacterized protein DUF742 [Pseudosporangium ferrugineum]
MMDFDARRHRDDAEQGQLVPLYVLVNGRTTPRNASLDLATQVVALPADTTVLEPEYREILWQCRQWMSIAEISAYLQRPLTVVKVLVDILLEQDYVALGSAAQRTVYDRALLETLLGGLQRL